MASIVRVADGVPGPHAGRFIRRWSPHSRAGDLDVETTASIREALRFERPDDAMLEWNSVSKVEARRPWDKKPNRPLTALTVTIVEVQE